MRGFLYCFFWLIALMPQSPAMAEALTSYMLYEDSSRALTPAQVATKDFTLVDSLAIAKGWTKSVFWLKFDLRTKSKATQYLTIAPAYITSTELYRLTDGEWVKIEPENPVKNLTKLARRENDVFPISTNSENDLFLLRIEAPKIVLAQFFLQEREDLIRQAISLSESLMFYLGLVCFITIYFLWNGIVKKNLFFLSTVALGVEIGIFRILIAGAKYPFGVSSGEKFIEMVMTVCLPLTASLYFFTLLKEHQVKGVAYQIATVSLAVWLFFAVIYCFDENNYVLTFSPYVGLGVFLLMTATPLIPSIQKKMGIPLALSLVMLGLILMTYRLFTIGWMPNYFDNLMTSGIHIPFFVLISVTAFSTLQKQKITLRSSQEISLKQANDETEKQKYRQDQQQKFMLMLTHELKNSLSVLRLYIQTDVADIKKFTPFAEQSINDMDAIIERCSQMDRLDRNQVTLNYQPLLLIELIRELIEKNSEKNRIELAQTIPSLQLNTDQVLLKTMIGNLLDNALKYSPSDSTVRITISYTKAVTETHTNQLDNMILISVSNRVLPSELPSADSIFKKYYRGPKANRTTGSGLGLYVSKSMAELLGGYLSYSEQQETVTMKLWLPI